MGAIKMRNYGLLGFGLVACAWAPAFSQAVTIEQPSASLSLSQPSQTPAATPYAAPAVIMAPTQTEAVLRSGTPVPLRMREKLSTKGKDLRVGYRFQMEVAEPVIVNGVTVIPAGSPATGEVTDIRNKGMWGKSGKINARPLFLRANGRQIRLTGQMDDKGITGTAAVVTAVVFVPVVGFFTTGTSAEIPLGAPVNAFIDEDIPFLVTSVAAQPMNVQAPAAP